MIGFLDAPLEDALQPSARLARELESFPLELSCCSTCGHVYLRHFVASLGAKQVGTSPATSPGLDETMGLVVDFLSYSCNLSSGSVVIDLGSHAGSIVSMFQKRGVDAFALELGSGNLKDFSIGQPSVEGLGRSATLITMHHVLANQTDPRGFLATAASMVEEGAFISIITGYHPDQFRASMFDWVYHEHLSYFTATDLLKLLDELGLTVRSALRLAYKGGALHLLVEKVGGQNVQHASTFSSLVAWERWASKSIAADFSRLAELIVANRNRVRELVCCLPSDTRLVGYGSSHSTSTLAHNLGLTPHLKWLVDDDVARHGLYSPLGALEIRHPKTLLDSGAVPVLLAWQHDWRLLDRLRSLGYRGEALCVMPDVQFVDID